MSIRRFCFTDYVIGYFRLCEFAGLIPYKYILVGQEVCPDTGQDHYQGYVELEKKTRIETIRAYLSDERWHVEVCRGNSEANVSYCSKEGVVVLEDGVRVAQGTRVDLSEVRDLALSEGMRSVARRATSYQQIRFAESVLKYLGSARSVQPSVVWFYGPTGSGKSRRARELAGERYYVKSTGGHWFDGYDGESTVIFDDWRDSWWPMTFMLGLLDRYEFRVEFKGGSRQFMADTIYITTTLPPSEVYAHTWVENKAQLERRVTEVIELKN